MIIFMVIAFADYSLFWNQFVSYFTCGLKLPQLLCILTFSPINEENTLTYTLFLMKTANFWEAFWLQISIFLSIATTIDLVLMIKHPF